MKEVWVVFAIHDVREMEGVGLEILNVPRWGRVFFNIRMSENCLKIEIANFLRDHLLKLEVIIDRFEIPNSDIGAYIYSEK